MESVSEEIPPVTLDKKTPNNTLSEIKESGPMEQVTGWESTCIKNTDSNRPYSYSRTGLGRVFFSRESEAHAGEN